MSWSLRPLGKNLGTAEKKMTRRMSRKENPQKLTQLSSRSHPRHLALLFMVIHVIYKYKK